MVQLAGSLYLVATAVFALIAFLVGVRLIRLSRRTGQRPEWLLGTSVMLTASLGYGLMILGLIGGKSAAEAGGPVLLFRGLTWAGWIFHNIGVVQALRFIVSVFRPEDAWARRLMVAMCAVLWGGWLQFVYIGGLETGLPRGGYWVAFSVIGSYSLWMAIESFGLYRRMRKQVALGLGDPLVCDRFKLWTLASLSSLASIWMVNLPSFFGLDLASAEGQTVSAISMLVTAGFGIATCTLYWLTFFPPELYRAFVAARARRLAPERA